MEDVHGNKIDTRCVSPLGPRVTHVSGASGLVLWLPCMCALCVHRDTSRALGLRTGAGCPCMRQSENPISAQALRPVTAQLAGDASSQAAQASPIAR